MPTHVFLSTIVQATLRHFHPEAKKSLKAALRELKKQWPTLQGMDLIRLRSNPEQPAAFRLRVGDWRIVFRARSRDLEVLRVFHREEGYGWLERA